MSPAQASLPAGIRSIAACASKRSISTAALNWASGYRYRGRARTSERAA